MGPNPDPQPCTGGPGGTLTNTITEQGHKVFNADGTLVHFFYIQTQDIYEDWLDGTYLLAEAVGPFEANVNASGTTTVSGTQQFRGTLYSPTGQIIGDVHIVSQFHVTFIDGTPVSNHGIFKIISSPC